MKASYSKYTLNFKRPSGTSRGVLKTKETWLIQITNQTHFGIGECGILRGLSVDDRPDYEEKLKWTCENIHLGEEVLIAELKEFPSIQFGLETAFLSLKAHQKRNDAYQLFPSEFAKGQQGMKINGLIWMGEFDYMKEQIQQKIDQGFSCIKMKIGAIDFEKEIKLLQQIRTHFSAEEIELRVDANGAFHPAEALEKLNRLSQFNLHSIEQPIAPKQWGEMKRLCQQTPLPIALDEELIGVFELADKRQLLQKIQPQYIILKPSLVGGFQGSDEWIELAEELGIGWWITSALESNIGLNAIAQYTFTKKVSMPQGLGTGSLYTNNMESPLLVSGEEIWYKPSHQWAELNTFFN